MKRDDVVKEYPPADPEGWVLNGDDPVEVAEPLQVDDPSEVADAHDALVGALFDAVAILRHIGGAVTIAPIREERAPDVFVTRGYLFRWHSTVPAVKPEPEPAGE